MWPEIVYYLKDASLVARIQEAFGVKIHYVNKLKKDSEESSRTVGDGNFRKFDNAWNNCSSNCGESRENGFTTSEKNSIHKRHLNSCARNDEREESSLIKRNPDYTVSNYFWYYLFLFGTELGDEIFYCTFIPFWFWNIDGTVGRRVISIWAIVMATGQMMKDVMCWPRPACPPVVRLQKKWSEEYGMPSTHAMIAISIPFSVVIFTMNRYIYPHSIGWTIAILWCTLVCISRLYLGMHTVLDILAGLVLSVTLMIPLIPLVDIGDYYLYSNIWVVIALITISIGVIVYYPCSEKWTPTRGDTAMVLSVTAGIYLGTWLNYNTGKMVDSTFPPPPYQITWPSYFMFGCFILRTFLGFFAVFLTRIIWKYLSYKVICTMLGINSKDLMRSQNYSGDKNKVLVDLVHKYVTCFMIGLNTVYILPSVFTIIGIGRPTFYTEI